MNYSTSVKTSLKKRYGQWAVVTGASLVICRELAKRLGEAGINIVLCSRQKSILIKLSKTLISDSKVETLVVAANISKPRGVERLIKVI